MRPWTLRSVGAVPHMEGSGPSKPCGFEGPVGLCRASGKKASSQTRENSPFRVPEKHPNTTRLGLPDCRSGQGWLKRGQCGHIYAIDGASGL